MADRWARVESLCHAALARPAGERAAFLADACGSDLSLRSEVESLLAHSHPPSSFLETPVLDASPLVGRQLGAYRITQAIGAGGMGEVYKGLDTRLGREVAIKVLPAEWVDDAQRRTRFEREARAVAALNHPNICTIHDVGHDNGIHFLVMELVDGESLAVRLAKGPLPLGEALARAIEIADALDKAHGQGIVHRDLKPANVMLTRTESGRSNEPKAKLLDFGLARIVRGAQPASIGAPGGGNTVTEAGAVLGTLHYMAPEQIEGRPADARADIFAFGALIYEMLTGRRAFAGTTPAAVMAAVLREDPAPLDPREVGRIVRRCLQKDPLRRYQSARDLLNDLEEVKDSPRQISPRMGGTSAPWFALAALVAVSVFGFAAWLSRRDGTAVRPQRFELQPPARVAIQPVDPNSTLAISPDGRWIAFRAVSSEPGRSGLYLRSIGELEARLIAPTGSSPFFSPDSHWLGFVAQNAMHKTPVGGGGDVERICEVPNVLSVRGVSWGEHDTIVFSLDRALWRVSASGGERSPLTSPTENARHYWPHVLAGGNAALFTIVQGYNDRWRQIAAVSFDSRETRVLRVSGTAPRYVSSGHLLYNRFGSLHAVPFDPSRQQVTGDPVKVLDNVFSFMLPGNAAFDISASGALVYVPGNSRPVPDGELMWLDRRGKTVPFLPERKPYIGAALDYEGKRLVASITDDFGEADLWLYDIDRGAWSQLTSGMHTWSEVVWSRDGEWIFFTSFKSGEAELFRIRPNERSPEPLTSEITTWEYPGSVSPDGKTLFFWRTFPSQADLMTLKLAPGARPEHLTNSPQFSESSPRISPDGAWLAYTSDESGSDQVHLRRLSDGRLSRVSADGGTNPWWSRDGRELFYQRGRDILVAEMNAAAGDSPVGIPRKLFDATFSEGAIGSVLSMGISDRFLAIRRVSAERRLVYVPDWIGELKETLDKR